MKPTALRAAMAIVGLLAVQHWATAQDHSQHQHKAKAEKQTMKSVQAQKEVYSCPMHPEVVSSSPGECPKCGMKLTKKTAAEAGSSSMMQMMGKPTFEKTSDSIVVRMWLMTQEAHKKMMSEHMSSKMHAKAGTHEMKGMEHSEMESNQPKMMEAMMTGTHHVMVEVVDETTAKAFEEGTVEIQALSPSGKRSSTKLMQVMDHFGGGLSLNETGSYILITLVNMAGKKQSFSVIYEVK